MYICIVKHKTKCLNLSISNHLSPLSIVAFNYVGNEVGISIIAVCVKYTDVSDYDVLSALYIEENCEFI